MEIERHKTTSGGLIGSVVEFPPSKTIISASISWGVNLNWLGGTMTLCRISSILRCYFFARCNLLWKTFGDITSIEAAAVHWVRSKAVELNFAKSWTHEGGVGMQLRPTHDSTSAFLHELAVVWQLNPDETVHWVKGLQWILSQLTIMEEERWLSLVALLSSTSCWISKLLRRPCSEILQKRGRCLFW